MDWDSKARMHKYWHCNTHRTYAEVVVKNGQKFTFEAVGGLKDIQWADSWAEIEDEELEVALEKIDAGDGTLR